MQSIYFLDMKQLLLIYILLLFHILSFSQKTLHFNRITTDIGLSEGFANCILKDYRGFIWIGTRDGLNRYDGYSFVVLKNDVDIPHSISNNVVQSLCETRDSVLLVGTHGGFNIYDYETGKFESYKHDPTDPSSLVNDAVYWIYEDQKGLIWVGTYGGGISVFDRKTKRFENFRHDKKNPQSLGGNSIRDITEDNEGNVWVALDGAGLSKFNRIQKTFTNYRHNPNDSTSLGNDQSLCCVKDSKGNLWVGSWAGGITVFNPKSGKAVKRYLHDADDPNTIASDENFRIVEASTGEYYIGTRNGLNILDPQTGVIQLFDHDPLVESSLGYNVISFIAEDRDGILWIGTEGGGASELDLYKKTFVNFKNNYKNNNSLCNNDVTAIMQDTEGIYWIATRGGLNKLDLEKNKIERIFHDQNTTNTIPSNQLLDIIQDSKGNIWMGSSDRGLSRFNKITGKYTTFTQYDKHEYPMNNSSVNVVFEDSKGYIWAGTYGGGLNRYNPRLDRFDIYNIDPDNQMKNVVLCIFEDSKQVLWAGTLGYGAVTYNDNKNKLEFYMSDPNENSISANIVYDIYEAYGYLWFCTGGGGFDRFDRETGEFKNYSTKNGLPSDQVMSVRADDSGNLWFSTTKGLVKFNVEDESFLNFDELDGLQGNLFNIAASFKNAKGQLFFGGKGGFTMFHPDSIRSNAIKPRVAITDFKIFNESVHPDEKGILKKQITQAEIIEIPYKKNNFSFEFTSLHFSSPTKNMYKYKMEGYDDDWFVTDYLRRFASYTNLPGGEYTFRVIASNNDGVWNEQGASIKIVIIPPFWKTLWFYMLVAVAIGALVYLFIRYREKQAKIEKARLQSEVDKAVAEVEQQKVEIMEQNKELQKKQAEERDRQWFNEGIALFADILRRNKDDIHKLSNDVLNNIIRYINASQGGLFILNDDNVDDKHLQLIASYGYQKGKFEESRLEIGESLVGNCFVEMKTKILHDLPQGYLIIDSGLGSTQPKHLVLIPLKLDELIFGVLEIATLNEIPQLHIEFLEKLAESVTSQLFTTKISIQTAQLLSQSQQQAEELRAQEEEARQNIEEMETNREEALRLRSEALGYLNSMNHSIIRADFDLNGRYIYGNTKFLDFFGYKSKEAMTLHVTDFFLDEDRAEFQRRWDALLKGSRHIENKYRHKTKEGTIDLLSTYTVVKDLHGQVQKVLYLGLDVADYDVANFTRNISDAQVLNEAFIRAELDTKGHISTANALFVQKFGLIHEDVEDLSIDTLMNEEEKKRFSEIWKKVVVGEKQEMEECIKANDGSEKWYKVVYIPSFINNQIQKISYISYDISDFKQVEKDMSEKIRVSQEREDALKKDLDEMKGKLKGFNN